MRDGGRTDERIADYFARRTASLGYRFEGQRLTAGGPYGAAAEASGWFHEQRASYHEKVPVRRMWRWLESEFPARYDGYVVVFSPLINASHNTPRFEDCGYRECVIPVSDRHLAAMDTALADLDAWNAHQGYSSPLMTFNEYGTWAVFIIDALYPEMIDWLASE